MTKRNAENERVKRRYLVYLKDAKGRDSASIDAAASAIERFEGVRQTARFPELPYRTGSGVQGPPDGQRPMREPASLSRPRPSTRRSPA